MGREENIAVFEDTRRLYQTNETLRAAVKASREGQVLIGESDLLPAYRGERKHCEQASVVVSAKRSFEAAAPYCRDGLKVCVHNFASAANPGGGVTRGALAQEECLCRCSTLYPNLDCAEMWDGFYQPHRREGNPLHNDDCIYTPGVVVFKSDTAMPALMREEDWYTVDVLTCAAPNLREKPSNANNPSDSETKASITRDELQRLHEKRLRRICDLACEKGSDVLILGAFAAARSETRPRPSPPRRAPS
jgi:uncharacterized protein (TIGR02452 family)